MKQQPPKVKLTATNVTLALGALAILIVALTTLPGGNSSSASTPPAYEPSQAFTQTVETSPTQVVIPVENTPTVAPSVSSEVTSTASVVVSQPWQYTLPMVVIENRRNSPSDFPQFDFMGLDSNVRLSSDEVNAAVLSQDLLAVQNVRNGALFSIALRDTGGAPQAGFPFALGMQNLDQGMIQRDVTPQVGRNPAAIYVLIRHPVGTTLPWLAFRQYDGVTQYTNSFGVYNVIKTSAYTFGDGSYQVDLLSWVVADASPINLVAVGISAPDANTVLLGITIHYK